MAILIVWIAFILFKKKISLSLMQKHVRIIVMPTEKNNQFMKLDKMPYIIYADLESLIKK